MSGSLLDEGSIIEHLKEQDISNSKAATDPTREVKAIIIVTLELSD